MKSIWIALLGLSVTAFGGCSTVNQPFAGASHRVLRETPQTQFGMAQTNVGRNINRVSLAGFQQDENEGAVSKSLKSWNSPRERQSSSPANSQPGNLMVSELVPGQVQGYESQEQVFTLADLEQMAVFNNPALATANASVDKSAGLFRQVGTRANPSLGYAASQLADQNTDQHTVFLEQEFVRGDKLALNRKVLRHTSEAQCLEIETQRYRVLTDVRVRFYEAIAAQRQLDATIMFAEVASQAVDVATSLQLAGEGTIVDVLQSKTLLSETNLAREQSEAAYRGAWKDLVAIAGAPDLKPARLVGDFGSPVGVQDWEEAYRVIKSESPELAAANAIVCEKKAIWERQQVQAIPNLTAQLGAGYDRGTDSGLVNFQIVAPMPTRNRNCGNIAAARADYTSAVENVKRIEMSIKSRLARSAQEFESANASVQRYEQEILPQARESLELSEKAYRAGELAFLQVLTVRRSYYDSNIRFIQSQGRLAQASAKVDGLLLTGGLDAPQDYTTGDDLRGQSFGGQ